MTVKKWRTPEAMSLAAAKLICAEASEAVRKRGRFSLVLSGGRTPLPLYRLLARSPYRNRMPWTRTHLFWGDERRVPPGSPDSNFGAAWRVLKGVSIPAKNVHPIPAEKPAAARAYEKTLRAFFSGQKEPAFDLVLLGVGEDGHTASLFPGDGALKENRRRVAVVKKPHGSPDVPRITLTFPALNAARRVLFLTAEEGKEEVLGRLLKRSPDARSPYPAGRVRPDGELIWFVSARPRRRD